MHVGVYESKRHTVHSPHTAYVLLHNQADDGCCCCCGFFLLSIKWEQRKSCVSVHFNCTAIGTCVYERLPNEMPWRRWAESGLGFLLTWSVSCEASALPCCNAAVGLQLPSSSPQSRDSQVIGFTAHQEPNSRNLSAVCRRRLFTEFDR